jgi:hypothetical protein
VGITLLKNYYDILGVEKTASEIDIKRAYRKLAVKLHPDKSHAPAAEDAFKCVNQAHTCLSHKDKKFKYDVFGEDENGGGKNEGATRDLSREDCRDMFFDGDGIPLQKPQAWSPKTGPRSFLHLSPALFLLIFAYLISADTPAYQLGQSALHTLRKTTPNYITEYFVTPEFENLYGYDSRAMNVVYTKIDHVGLEAMREACAEEKGAAGTDQDHEDDGSPNCDMLAARELMKKNL